MKDTPRIGPGRQPVVIHLLAPNHRAVQTTTDLCRILGTPVPTGPARTDAPLPQAFLAGKAISRGTADIPNTSARLPFCWIVWASSWASRVLPWCRLRLEASGVEDDVVAQSIGERADGLRRLCGHRDLRGFERCSARPRISARRKHGFRRRADDRSAKRLMHGRRSVGPGCMRRRLALPVDRRLFFASGTLPLDNIRAGQAVAAGSGIRTTSSATRSASASSGSFVEPTASFVLRRTCGCCRGWSFASAPLQRQGEAGAAEVRQQNAVELIGQTTAGCFAS